MEKIIYKYIHRESDYFKEAANLRFNVLFKPYEKIERYVYDDLDYKSLHLVAMTMEDEKIVGYSRLTPSEGRGLITNVSVDSEYSKQGIGFNMLRTHINRAHSINIDYMYLNARINTVKFYEKVGFKVDGEPFISDKSGITLQKMYIIIE